MRSSDFDVVVFVDDASARAVCYVERGGVGTVIGRDLRVDRRSRTVGSGHADRCDVRILVEERFFLEVEAPVAGGAPQGGVGAGLVTGRQVGDVAAHQRDGR